MDRKKDCDDEWKDDTMKHVEPDERILTHDRSTKKHEHNVVGRKESALRPPRTVLSDKGGI